MLCMVCVFLVNSAAITVVSVVSVVYLNNLPYRFDVLLDSFLFRQQTRLTVELTGFFNQEALLKVYHTKNCSYRLRRSLGWLRFSRFFSIRSASSCFSTTVAYSILPCRAAIRRDATLPLSRMEKDLCASSVWINVNRNILLCSSWLKRRKAFSTLAGDWWEKDEDWLKTVSEKWHKWIWMDQCGGANKGQCNVTVVIPCTCCTKT